MLHVVVVKDKVPEALDKSHRVIPVLVACVVELGYGNCIFMLKILPTDLAC